MNAVKIYTMSPCPWCDILKKRLKHDKVEYDEVTDSDIIKSKGIEIVPVLEVNGQLMDFDSSIRWLNEKKEGVV